MHTSSIHTTIIITYIYMYILLTYHIISSYTNAYLYPFKVANCHTPCICVDVWKHNYILLAKDLNIKKIHDIRHSIDWTKEIYDIDESKQGIYTGMEAETIGVPHLHLDQWGGSQLPQQILLSHHLHFLCYKQSHKHSVSGASNH